jgi:hypothetical protein
MQAVSLLPILDLLAYDFVFFGQMLKLISICLTSFSIRSSTEEADFPAKICLLSKLSTKSCVATSLLYAINLSIVLPSTQMVCKRRGAALKTKEALTLIKVIVKYRKFFN